MADTIKLLEAIGQDAALRHAPADELIQLLEKAEASKGLKEAVAHGDLSRLLKELGQKPLQAPQSSQTHSNEDDDEPGRHGHEDPPPHSVPDHDAPPPRR